MADYTYQGDDIDIAGWEANFTSRIGDGRGDSEEGYHHAVVAAAAAKRGGRFLDVGSGHGRIVGWLKPYASYLLGVEPDIERFDSCVRNFANEPDIELLNTTTATLRQAPGRHRFDLIVASMVIQHISTGTCQALLEDVRSLLDTHGVAIVSTTHFPDERFTYQSDPSPKDAGQFDEYASRSNAHDHGLPVRFFSRASFTDTLARAGLTTVVWEQFSYPRAERLEGLAGLYGIPPAQLQDCGFSQFALVVPTARSH